MQVLALMFPPQTRGDFASVWIPPKQNSVSIPRDSVLCGLFLLSTRPSPTPSPRRALLLSLRIDLCTLVNNNLSILRSSQILLMEGSPEAAAKPSSLIATGLGFLYLVLLSGSNLWL